MAILSPGRPLKFQKLVTVLLIAAGLVVLYHGRHRGSTIPIWHRGMKGLVGPVHHDFSAILSSQAASVPDASDAQTSTPANSQARVSCRGARGLIINESPDDILSSINVDFSPDPYAGSYNDLQLDKTWMTADHRYGPYGRGEDQPDYFRARPEWERINWAKLQNACAQLNRHRFGGEVEHITSYRRLPLASTENFQEDEAEWKTAPRPAKTTGRTAIVLRAWSDYPWTDEVKWSVRSLITEAALATSGDYAVFILIDVHPDRLAAQPVDPMKSEYVYDNLLDELVPREFRDMSLLFHEPYLREWYTKTVEHRAEFQMFQPLQLFAKAYPGFDHFWEMEMDVRFTGHAGELLDSLARFARMEPHKQARQRASFSLLSSTYTSYAHLLSLVNASLDGGDAYYAGVTIPEISKSFLGSQTPFPKAEDDDFKWGVGDEADFLTLFPCNNVTLHTAWIYHKYAHGFTSGLRALERIVCPVAVQRASFNLLSAIHVAQRSHGLAIATESTLGTFALWLGGKISLPPLPFYSRKDHLYTPDELSRYVNGGLPSPERDGMAQGEWVYRIDGDKYLQNTSIVDGLFPTLRYQTSYPQELWQAWMRGLDEGYDRDAFPSVVRRDGKVYLPNTIMHPVHDSSVTWEEWHKTEAERLPGEQEATPGKKKKRR